jgi:pyruvate dehydrogenase E2 component (dihydrolipoamide acetyltransferase)
VDVIMPKMGDAMTEGKVLQWKKRPGDAVSKGEPIAEIETDKVNVDLEAEDGGVLLQIVVGEGETAEVGSTIAVIGEPGQKVEPRPKAQPAKPEPQRAQPDAATSSAAPTPPAARPDERVKASPVARKVAADHGIDLSTIRGTGPDGRITKEDVEAAVGGGRQSAPAAPAGAEFEEQPLTKIRQTIAKRMLDSKQQAPHFYVSITVTMDEALRVRQQLNAGGNDRRKISINDLVLRAAALALRSFPNLNAALVNGQLRRHRRINLAVAIALPEGLIAPVIHDADRKSLAAIAEAARALGERARSGRLRGEDYEGGTFTVSNLGMYDVDSFVAIINPPHAAILAVGSAKPTPIVKDGKVDVATMMNLTVSGDHRVTDGAEAARFLGEVKRLLENPVLLLTEAAR